MQVAANRSLSEPTLARSSSPCNLPAQSGWSDRFRRVRGRRCRRFDVRADDIAASLAHSGELQRKVAHLALFRSLSEVSTVKNGFTIRPLAPTAISAFGVVVMR